MWVCVYCGKVLPEQEGPDSACCGEVGHTEWVRDRDGPDYRLPEQYYADMAHEKRQRRMRGEEGCVAWQLVAAIAVFASTATTLYVLIHFITKFW
jgi:hypothetical protein